MAFQTKFKRRACALCGVVFVSESARNRQRYCSQACRAKAQNAHQEPLLDRFWSKVDKSGANGCWLWIGARFGFGHGVIKIDQRNTLAHRFSWELVHGPAGSLFVLHRCDVPACVNPDHLFLGTQADNVQDCVRKGRRATSGKPRAA